MTIKSLVRTNLIYSKCQDNNYNKNIKKYLKMHMDGSIQREF